VRALIFAVFAIYVWVSFAGAQDVVSDVHGRDPARWDAENAKNCRSLALLGMTSFKEFLGALGFSAVEDQTQQKMDMQGMDTQDAHTQDRHTQGMDMPGMDMSQPAPDWMPSPHDASGTGWQPAATAGHSWMKSAGAWDLMAHTA